MYNLLIRFLLHPSAPVPVKICINLVQFTQSNAFCQSVKHTHNSSTLSKVHSDILGIPVASPVSRSLLNPD
jgi:hypothetical protein